MTDNNIEQETTVDDRRSTLEAAFDNVEQEKPPTLEKPAVENTPAVDTEEKPAVEEKPGVEKPAVEEKLAVEEKQLNVDKPPQSWKAGQKAKWAAIEPDVRQEILRRERETTQVLHDTANVRQFASQFQEVISPFAARFQELNAHPMIAIRELLKADQILSTSPPAERAQYMAKLISDYKIDVEQLDQALSGTISANPLESKFEQLVNQKISPLQQYIARQEQMIQQQELAKQRELQETVESMAANAEKYPYFEQVRESMADIVEILAKRGQNISIEAAYNKAVAMDPAISEELAAKAATDQRLQKLNANNVKAQKALAASVSIAGAPQNSTRQSPAATDRRATIESAFAQLDGR